VNEVCQPDSQKLIPISAAVRKMGFAGWVVSIRHEVTHGHMPPMDMLKRAIAFCHLWLWDQHWSRPYHEAIRETLSRELLELKIMEKHQCTKLKIIDSLEAFSAWRDKDSSIIEVGAELKRSDPFKLILDLLDDQPEELISSFIEICLSQGEIGPHISIDSFNDVFYGYKHIGEVPGSEQNYYRPIIQLIDEKNYLHIFLLELTRAISTNSTPVRSRARLSGWANILLRALLCKAAIISDHNWRTVLKSIVMASQFYNDDHIKGLLSHLKGKISEKYERRILELLNIGNLPAEGGSNLDAVSSSVKTMAQLKASMSKREIPNDLVVEEDGWSLAPMYELGPLGLTADQSTDTLDLELDQFGIF